MNKNQKIRMACISLVLILLSGLLNSGIDQITTPEAYLGYKPGADFHLMTYEEAIGYLEKIAGESDRIQIMDMGPTSYGRRMKYAVISSEANMANNPKGRGPRACPWVNG